jgi:tetratricopeptide (TPR) repeat protein
MSMNNLALAYQSAGRPALAVPLLEKTLEFTRARLGADHRDTLTCMSNLATVYQATRKLELAVPLYEDILKVSRASLGADHPDTLVRMNNLAAGYHAAGKPDVALRLQEEAAQGVEKRQFQMENASRIVHNLIAFYEHEKHFDRAEVWRRKWLAAMKQNSATDAVTYANELVALGKNLLEQKEWTDAEAVLRECLAIRQKELPNAWNTFHTQSLLGGALLGQRKYSDSEALLQQGYDGLQKRSAQIPPEGRVRLEEAVKRLARLYDDWGKTAKAQEWKAKLQVMKDVSAAAGPKN